MCVCMYLLKSEEVVRFLVAVVTIDGEMPNMGAGNLTWDLWESRSLNCPAVTSVSKPRSLHLLY